MNKIVIIEDTSVLMIRLEKVLKRHGFKDIDQLNPSSLPSAMHSHSFTDVSLFIVDLDNRKSSGTDIIKSLKKESVLSVIPVLGMSQHSNVSSLKNAVLAGCNDFMIKPFNDSSLLMKVNKLLGLSTVVENHTYTPELTESDLDHDNELIWDKDFEINIEEIDAEHKAIIDKYEQLYYRMKDGKGHMYYSELLSFLNDYVTTHFSHEERLHGLKNYTYKDEHREIHQQFKASVKAIYENGKDKAVTDMDLIKMNLFIKNWLIHHILIEDRKFGEFLKSK